MYRCDLTDSGWTAGSNLILVLVWRRLIAVKRALSGAKRSQDVAVIQSAIQAALELGERLLWASGPDPPQPNFRDEYFWLITLFIRLQVLIWMRGPHWWSPTHGCGSGVCRVAHTPTH